MSEAASVKDKGINRPVEAELYAVTRISEKELAEFMGISVKTLQRMDNSGALPALRSSKGRRIYTTEHIAMALDIMAASYNRPTKVSFCKNGATSMCGKVAVPRKWLEQIGINQNEPWAEIGFDGEAVFIRKPKEKSDD